MGVRKGGVKTFKSSKGHGSKRPSTVKSNTATGRAKNNTGPTHPSKSVGRVGATKSWKGK